jgi:hypothetical protein
VGMVRGVQHTVSEPKCEEDDGDRGQDWYD